MAPAKETLDELPPGLIGNVQNGPRCPIQLLLSTATAGCPENTAVGYATEVALHGGNGIVKGKPQIFSGISVEKNSSLIYNLEPSAGHPAMFGFSVAYPGANGRSCSTHRCAATETTVSPSAAIGGNGINLAELQGAKLTFCENGAKQEVSHRKDQRRTKELLVQHGAGELQAVPDEPDAVLRPGAGQTLARDPRGDEPDRLRLHAGMPSFLTGCESLQFNPELEFRPSPPVRRRHLPGGRADGHDDESEGPADKRSGSATRRRSSRTSR